MRVFTPQEATALLPVVRPLVSELLGARADLAIGLLEVEAAQRMQADAQSSRQASTLARHVRAIQLRIVELVEKIQTHGCIVKDIDLGLIDFPALRGDQIVNLCWKMDEPEVGFWHGMDEGFAGRKPL